MNIIFYERNMRFYSNYQRPAFELVGVGFYFIAIASLLAVSLSGSVYFLLRTTGAEQTSSPSSPLSSIILLENRHHHHHHQQQHSKHSNLTNEELIMSKLDLLISDKLCATNLTCKFEKRHLPLFVQSLRDDEKKRLQRFQTSTVLVVTFNRNTAYYVTPLVHSFYRRIFAHVFYCGPSRNSTVFRRGIEQYFNEELGDYFRQHYLAYQSDSPNIDGYGENNYFCFNLALQHIANTRPDFNIDGIFVLADDAIFSFWNVVFKGDRLFKFSSSYSLPFPKLIYHTETLNACNINGEPSGCDFANPWRNWPQNYRLETSGFYHDLVRKSRADPVYARCLDRITNRTKGEFRVMTGFSDMFYVAKNDFKEALAMFELASRHKVFQEIAVPTVFGCFDPETLGVIDDSGDNTNSLDVNRKSPWQAYDATRLLTHPFKLSNIVKALAGDNEARQSRMLGICLYCMLDQYSKYLSLLVLL